MKNLDTKLNEIFSAVFKIKNSKINIASYKNTKNWDSLNHLNLILSIESNFKIKIDPEISINLLSYEKIRKYLKKKLKN